MRAHGAVPAPAATTARGQNGRGGRPGHPPGPAAPKPRIPSHHNHPAPLPPPDAAGAAPHDTCKQECGPQATRRPPRPPSAAAAGTRPATVANERIHEKNPPAHVVVERGAVLQVDLGERPAPSRACSRIGARPSPGARRGCSRRSAMLLKVVREGCRPPEAQRTTSERGQSGWEYGWNHALMAHRCSSATRSRRREEKVHRRGVVRLQHVELVQA